MITCPSCGEKSEDQFDSCWKCGAALRESTGRVVPQRAIPPAPASAAPVLSVVKNRIFRGTFTTWKTLLNEAGEFATRVGKERLISISHSEDQSESVVVVWYWGDPYQNDD